MVLPVPLKMSAYNITQNHTLFFEKYVWLLAMTALFSVDFNLIVNTIFFIFIRQYTSYKNDVKF